MLAILDAALPLLLIITVGVVGWFVLRYLTWRQRFIGTIGLALASIAALIATSAAFEDYILMGIVITIALLEVWFYRPDRDRG